MLYGTGDESHASTMTTACAPTRPPRRSRAYPQPGAALERDRIGLDARGARALHVGDPCPACNGYRLKPEALAVKIAGRHIGEVTELSIREADRWFDRAAGALNAKQNEIAARILKEIRERLRFLERCRPRLPHAGAGLRHAVGRRKPAHPAGLADRLGADRRALRARRALDRPAPARQRPPARHAEAPARPRQHGDRGRARRGRHPAPPTMSSTWGPAAGVHGGHVIAEGTPSDHQGRARSTVDGRHRTARLVPPHSGRVLGLTR